MEAVQSRSGPTEIAVAQRILRHECEAPGGRQGSPGPLKRLVTVATFRRRSRQLQSAPLRRGDCHGAAFGDVWTLFDSRWGHSRSPARTLPFPRW